MELLIVFFVLFFMSIPDNFVIHTQYWRNIMKPYFPGSYSSNKSIYFSQQHYTFIDDSLIAAMELHYILEIPDLVAKP